MWLPGPSPWVPWMPLGWSYSHLELLWGLVDFLLCVVGTQWTVMIREVTWSDIGFKGVSWSEESGDWDSCVSLPELCPEGQRCQANPSLSTWKSVCLPQSYPNHPSQDLREHLSRPLLPTAVWHPHGAFCAPNPLQGQVLAVISGRFQQPHSPTLIHTPNLFLLPFLQ